MSELPKFSISTLVIIGLLAGIATGIFFGELVAFLGAFGNAYVRLLQMTVLPYVFVSLVSGLGRLSYRLAGQIALKAGAVVLVIWVIGFLTMLLATTAYPDWKSASFFSTALVESGQPLDFLELYIPSNVFYSLTNTIVPAVVVFSLAFGAALIGVPGKEPLLDLFRTVSEALMKITRAVVWVAPVGIFAISASAAGTLRAAEFDRLQVFVWFFVVVWLLVLLWTLPLLVAAFTPTRYRDLLLKSRDAMVTAFATGSLLIVIPMMAEAVKDIAAEHIEDSEEAEAMVDVLVPTAYNFPSIGMISILGFVPFAAWFNGTPFSVIEYGRFAAIGLFTAFGGSSIALPNLLDTFSLPSDLFQLYLVSDIFVGRMAMSMATMHVIVLCLLSIALMFGGIRLTARRVGLYVVLVASATWALTTGTGFLISRFVPHEYTQDQALVNMHVLETNAEVSVLTEPPPPLAEAQRIRPRYESIRGRGSIRVGYLPDQLPFAFRNTAGQVVGLDIAMAHELAMDLQLRLDIIRVESEMEQALIDGRVDIVMSGVTVTPELSERFMLTPAHMEQTFAFVVDDNRRAEFSDRAEVLAMTGLRVAVPDVDFYLRWLAFALPGAEIVPVDTPRSFFRGQVEADALAFTAEAGSAWSLIYPDFTVAVPQPARVRIPMTYVLPRGETELRRLLSDWLEMKRRDGTLDRLYDYWVLGRTEDADAPRWSIIRDVLGWVD